VSRAGRQPSFTARIERAHSYRARSASKKDGWLPARILLSVRVARAWETNRLPLPSPAQPPPMPISMQQCICLAWSPGASCVEVEGSFAGQQRGIEAPRRFGEIRADEEGLIPDHHVAEQRFISFGERTKGFCIVKLQSVVAHLERPPRILHGKTEREPL